MGTVIGLVFVDIFGPMVSLVTNGINAMIRAWRSMSDTTRRVISVISLLASGFAVMLGAVMAFGGALTLAITLLGELLVIVVAVMGGIVLAMLPVIAGIGALIGTAYALYRAWETNFGGLRDFVKDWAGTVRRTFLGLHQIFTEGRLSGGIWGDLIANESEELRNTLRAIETFVGRARELWTGFVNRFRELWTQLGPSIRFLRESVDRLGSSIRTTTRHLARQANAVSDEAYSEFGATLAEVVVGALERVIVATAQTILVLGWLIRAIQHPAFQAFLTLLTAIADAVSAIVRGVSFLLNIGESLNPVAWLQGLEQWRRGAEVTAIPALRAAGMEAPTTSERLALLTGAELPPRPTTTEDATSRPATASARAEGDRVTALVDAFFRAEEARTRGGGAGRRIENHVAFQVDRRTLQEIIQTINVDGETGDGEVVTDPFGYPQSVPG
jgi:hypothetical protein